MAHPRRRRPPGHGRRVREVRARAHVLTLGGVSSLDDVAAVIADKIEECIPDAIVEGLPQMLGIEARDEEEATEEEEEEEEEMDEDDEEAFDLEGPGERDAGAF